MSKKHTAKELRYTLKSIIGNGYEHMESIIKELRKIDMANIENLPAETKGRVQVLNTMLTLINDIVHPGHAMSYQMFAKYGPMIDFYVKNQKIAFEKKLVPDCFSLCCDPDGSRSILKADEIKKKLEEYEKSKFVSDEQNGSKVAH